jgi:hypothetical protein
MKKLTKTPPPMQEMLIPANLPTFNGEKALLIATGKQDAVFYLAQNGILKSIDSFLIETPKYSDREGHFKTRGAGKTIRSGAVYENKKGKVITDFIKEFQKRFGTISKKHKIARLYIYSPSHMHTYIREALPKAFQNKITMEIEGNFFKTHPLTLLKKIHDTSNSKKVTPKDTEEEKILNRRVKAKSVKNISKKAF